MTKADLFIYEKDLAKDIVKNKLNLDKSGKPAFTVSGEIPFKPSLEIDVSNPQAIIRDRLLTKLVRKDTDKIYNALLPKIAKEMEKFKKAGDTTPKAVQDMETTIRDLIIDHAVKIQAEAFPVVADYLEKRNDGKAAKKKYKYNTFKAFGAVAGGVTATGGAIAATALSAGAGWPAIVAAVAGTAKAYTRLVRTCEKNNKDLGDLEDSINQTLRVLRKDLVRYQDNKDNDIDSPSVTRQTTARELGAKATREFFATNIRSIKKLEQDTAYLKQRAQMANLIASKKGALAGDMHKQAKAIRAQGHSVERVIQSITADSNTSPAAKKLQLEGLKITKKKTAAALDDMKKCRDEALKIADDMKKEANRVLLRVDTLADIASQYKEKRGPIAKASVVFKLIDMVLNAAAQDWNSLTNAAASADDSFNAAAGLITSLSADTVNWGNELRKMNR